MKKLPNKPSTLIRLAIADLEKIEKNSDYSIDMYDWHVSSDQTHNGLCAVCLAGSVIACSLGKPSFKTVFPSHFPKKISRKLFALNEFREGYIKDGLRDFGISESKISCLRNKQVDVIDYQDNPKQFKKQMRYIAYNLKRAGL